MLEDEGQESQSTQPGILRIVKHSTYEEDPGSTSSRQYISLKLPDQLMQAVMANPQCLSLDSQTGNLSFTDLETGTCSKLDLIKTAETQPVDVLVPNGSNELALIGHISQRWSVKPRLGQAKQDEVRQMSQEAEKERLSRQTVSLDLPLANGKQRQVAKVTTPAGHQSTQPIANKKRLLQHSNDPMTRPVFQPTALTSNSGAFSQPANDSIHTIVPSSSLSGNDREGASWEAKLAALLSRGPLTLKEIQNRIHAKVSLLQQALSKVASLDPETTLYHLKPLSTKHAETKQSSVDEQRLVKYNALLKVYHEKLAIYNQLGEQLRTRSEKANQLLTSPKLDQLQEFLKTTSHSQHLQQEAQHAKLCRELSILRTDLIKASKP